MPVLGVDRSCRHGLHSWVDNGKLIRLLVLLPT